MKTECVTSVKGRKKKKPNSLSIIVLSSKPANRMKSYGPTPMLKLGHHSLIDIQINSIKTNFDKPEIIFCTGCESNKIVKYIKGKYPNDNIRVVENQIYEESNCCESLRLALNNIVSESVLVCNGELVFYPELVRVHEESSYILSLSNSRKKSNMEIGSVSNEINQITNMSFGLPVVWSEIFYLNSLKEIEHLRKLLWTENYNNKFIFELLNDFNKKHPLKQSLSVDDVCKIDSVKQYHQIRNKYENNGSQLYVRNFN